MNETQKLEKMQTEGKLDDPKIKRLAGIYFLTSRCTDLRTLLNAHVELEPSLYCFCGGKECSPTKSATHTAAMLLLYRQKISEGAEPYSVELRAMSKEFAADFINEGKYLALKELRARQLAGHPLSREAEDLLTALERELDALE